MSERSDAIAAALRKAILRGDYADGEGLSQSRLTQKFGAHRSVVWRALRDLQDEGHVSRDNRQRRFHVNASYATRQLQTVLNRLADVERLAASAVTELTDSPIPLRASPTWWREHAARERERLASLAALKSERRAVS